MNFNPNLPVQTRDGRKAKIFRTNLESNYSIGAIITEENGEEEPQSFTSDGLFATGARGLDNPDDLINIPEKRWAMIWRIEGEYGVTVIADDKVLPELKRRSKAIACLPFTEGEGL